MKNNISRFKLIFSLALISYSMTFCSDDKDPEPDLEYLEINNFIEENMSIYYFWNEEMPEIDPKKEKDPEAYFQKLLKKPDDRWSFITDDYQALVNYFAGIQKTTGYSLLPMLSPTGNNKVIAFIEYVHRDSPAEKAGLKRGDMICKIDGQEMNTQNFSDLLSRESFDITLGKLNTDNTITELPTQISLDAVELKMHPIIASTIIEQSGHKIGYLAYSSFVSNYDTAIISTFEKFKNEGISDLILDLRYNGGGSMNSASLIADIIVPQGNAGNTFIEEVYNDLLTRAYEEQLNYTTDSFRIQFEENPQNINLDRIFVLTTSSTASASETIIYGLDPYMQVTQIGDTTHGKYYGSFTIHDEKGNHNWAIQPIVMRSINATNNIDYTRGLSPDNPDNYLNDLFYLFPHSSLGDPDEYMTAKAISVITGEPFPYQDLVNELKSSTRLLQKAPGLREKIDPLRLRMWKKQPFHRLNNSQLQ
jgi:carboxyl-terminal processing protease